MNIAYLLKILKTDKISELVENMDLPFIDIDLSIDDAIAAGQVEVDRDKYKGQGYIKALVDPEITFDSDLAGKLLRVMKHREQKEVNITRGRLTNLVKNGGSQFNYPYHEYLMALQYLLDSGQVIQMEVPVPKVGKRPYHNFVFLCFPDNPNDEWNAREVNKWIDSCAKKGVK